MTILSLDSCVYSNLKDDKLFSGTVPPQSESRSSTTSRFSLRKRSCSRCNDSEVNLTAVSSAFLSGLFADVAAAQNNSYSTSATECEITDDIKLDPHYRAHFPNKKSRIDLYSFPKSTDTVSLQQLPESPNQCNTTYFDIIKADHAISIDRTASLHLQLSSVTNPFRTDNSAGESYHPTTSLIFPHLPNTVSDTSCAPSMSHNLSDLTMSGSGLNTDKDVSYGWFVEMDDDENDFYGRPDPYLEREASSLAFCAPVAPKGCNFDAEIEWAKAADTVDDVLGDFF